MGDVPPAGAGLLAPASTRCILPWPGALSGNPTGLYFGCQSWHRACGSRLIPLLEGHGPNFEGYLAAFRGVELPTLGDFPNWDVLDVWLKSRAAPVSRGDLSISGVRYCLGYSRAEAAPLLLRLPLPEGLRRPAVEKDRERLWLALDKADESLHSSSEHLKGLQSAALALHFVAQVGCVRDFSRFLEHLEKPLPPLLVFATRDDAESWLERHPRPPHGASVKVGEEVLAVGYQRERNQRTLVCFG